METVNEKLLHQAVNHAIDLQHYSAGAVRRMISILNASDEKLTLDILNALERLPRGSFTVQRLSNLLKDVMRTNAQAYSALKSGVESDLQDLVKAEAEYQSGLFKTVLPVSLSVSSIDPEQVYTAAMSRPFQVSKNGAVPMAAYLENLSADRAKKIQDAIRLGYVNGETIDQMVRTIRGTKTSNYADGLMEAPRHYVEGMVRTSINHMSNFTAQRFYEANSELIKGVMWVSTLDSRTSPICQARDSQVYPLNSGPRPPAHIGCRSRVTPILKSWRELGLEIDEFKSTRASMDGQVPEDITYQTWLDKQSADRQDEILGKTKAKLFREGEAVDKFVDNKVRTLTIAQLRERNKALFDKLGI